jgi:hypothetical protein
MAAQGEVPAGTSAATAAATAGTAAGAASPGQTASQQATPESAAAEEALTQAAAAQLLEVMRAQAAAQAAAGRPLHLATERGDGRTPLEAANDAVEAAQEAVDIAKRQLAVTNELSRILRKLRIKEVSLRRWALGCHERQNMPQGQVSCKGPCVCMRKAAFASRLTVYSTEQKRGTHAR